MSGLSAYAYKTAQPIKLQDRIRKNSSAGYAEFAHQIWAQYNQWVACISPETTPQTRGQEMALIQLRVTTDK